MDYNTDFDLDFEARINDLSEIETANSVQTDLDLIPFPEAIMDKLNHYIHWIFDNGEACNAIITGCSKEIADDIINLLAIKMELNLRPFQNCTTEGEIAATLTNSNPGDIGYIQDYCTLSNKLQKVLSEAILSNALDIVTGKGQMATSYHLPLPRLNYILYTSEISNLPNDLLEGFRIVLDFNENVVDKHQYIIKKSLSKYGLLADDEVIDSLSTLYLTEQGLQRKLLELRSKALVAGINMINKQLLEGSYPESISLSSIDEMQAKEFELFIGDLLFLMGFENISVSNEIDSSDSVILADRDKVRYCIRCQLSKKPVGIGIIKDAIVFREIHYCHVMCVITNSKYELAAKNLADVSNIVLWDRNDLEEFIENANQTRE